MDETNDDGSGTMPRDADRRLPGMRLVSIALTLLLPAMMSAQEAAPKRTLQSILRENRAAIAKAAQSEDPDAYDKAVARFCAALREYLKDEAKGEEKHLTRFQLVFALMSGGKRDQAQKVLAKFDAENASCVNCGEAAYMASTFRMKNEYEAWIAIALDKRASHEQRMELGILLMAKLRKPDLASKLFADALKAAKDSEAKAEVMWHLARATREREDVPGNAYDKALLDLARAYPKTRFGGIAGDRLIAMDFRVGGDPLPIAIAALDGGEFSLAKQRGKAVLICFWLPGDPRCANALTALEKLHKEFAESGLSVMGISLGSKTRTRTDIKERKITFGQACAPGGLESDLALRYRVEDAPYCILLGRGGKIRGMNFVMHDEFGLKQLTDAVLKSIEAKK
jgi:peroxiredoxin